MDEIQEGFAMLNRANADDREVAEKASRIGHDHFVIAAREDVGLRKEDHLKDVPFRKAGVLQHDCRATLTT